MFKIAKKMETEFSPEQLINKEELEKLNSIIEKWGASPKDKEKILNLVKDKNFEIIKQGEPLGSQECLLIEVMEEKKFPKRKSKLEPQIHMIVKSECYEINPKTQERKKIVRVDIDPKYSTFTRPHSSIINKVAPATHQGGSRRISPKPRYYK